MNKRKIGWILIGLGIAFVAAALGLTGLHILEDRRGAEASGQALEAMRQAEIPESTILPTEASAVSTVPSGPREPETLELFELEGDDYIGWITLPAFELELPIMHQIQEDRLKKAPCLEKGSPVTDDAVISGHNYKSHFLSLHHTQPGDTVYFTYLNGFRVEYAVAECAVVDPRDLEAVLQSGHDLVLYTCTSDGENRWAVYCDRADP